MTRDDGFLTMDVSTSILDDPKFRVIARDRPDLFALSFTAYMATLAESWRAGQRVSVDDAWPLSLPRDERDQVVQLLKNARLVDRRGMLPPKAWEGWFSPAFARRERRREAGALGGRTKSLNRRSGNAVAKPKRRSSNARAELEQSPSVALPDRPSVRPTDSPSDRTLGIGVRDGLPNLDAESQALLEKLTGESLLSAGDRQLRELDRQVERHGADSARQAWRATADASGARLSLRQITWAAMKVLEPLPDGKAAAQEHDLGKRRARTAAETEARSAYWARYGWTPQDDDRESPHVH